MNDIIWLFLGGLDANRNPAPTGKMAAYNPQGHPKFAGELIEPVGYVPVSVRKMAERGATAVVRRHSVAGKPQSDAAVTQVLTAPVRVFFSDGESALVHTGILVLVDNGDLFYAIPSHGDGRAELFASEGGFAQSIASLRVIGRVRAVEMDITALSFPKAFAAAVNGQRGLKAVAAGGAPGSGLNTKNGGAGRRGFDPINVMCFCRGTRIATARGEIPVEDLSIGDRVITRDRGYQKVRWTGRTSRRAQADFAPISIRQGVFKNRRNLRVAPGDRILVIGATVEFYIGHPEVLVPAKYLVDGKSILRETSGPVEYFCMLFDQHELVLSEGCWIESFHPATLDCPTLCGETRAEILDLFPGLDEETGVSGLCAARYVVSREEAVVLLKILRSHDYLTMDTMIC